MASPQKAKRSQCMALSYLFGLQFYGFLISGNEEPVFLKRALEILYIPTLVTGVWMLINSSDGWLPVVAFTIFFACEIGLKKRTFLRYIYPLFLWFSVVAILLVKDSKVASFSLWESISFGAMIASLFCLAIYFLSVPQVRDRIFSKIPIGMNLLSY